MKSIFTVMVLGFVAVLLTPGSGSILAHAAGKAVSKEVITKCDQEFKSLDAGNKGYLTSDEIREGMYGHSHMGVGPTHKGESVFTSMDTNKDGKVTENEFCAWKGR